MSERIIVPKDRIVERTQGCWNCRHFIAGEEAVKIWNHKRQKDLEVALKISLEAPEGENHPKVRNIKEFVNRLDHGIAGGAIGKCGGDGETAEGKPVGDFVVNNYLCHKWSAAEGASVARGGQKADDLPEEIAEKLDGRPTTLAELTKKVVE